MNVFHYVHSIALTRRSLSDFLDLLQSNQYCLRQLNNYEFCMLKLVSLVFFFLLLMETNISDTNLEVTIAKAKCNSFYMDS